MPSCWPKKLSLEEETGRLREKVREVEIAVLDEWEQERVDQSHLREKLNDIASEVSRLVYAVDGDAAPTEEASLFDTVRKFAGDDFKRCQADRSSARQQGRGPTRIADRAHGSSQGTPGPSVSQARRPQQDTSLPRSHCLLLRRIIRFRP